MSTCGHKGLVRDASKGISSFLELEGPTELRGPFPHPFPPSETFTAFAPPVCAALSPGLRLTPGASGPGTELSTGNTDRNGPFRVLSPKERRAQGASNTHMSIRNTRYRA